MVRRLSIVLALVVVGAPGCKRLGPDYVPTLKIWPHSTANGDTVRCRGGFCTDALPDGGFPPNDAVSLVLNDAGLNARLETSTGDIVTLLGESVTLGPTTQDATFPHALGGLADAHALDEWLTTEVKVSTPRGTVVAKKVELQLGWTMRQRIEKAKTGPVTFPGETLTASAGKLAYVRPASGGEQPYLVGDGRWRDIDLVVFETTKGGYGAGKVCPGEFHYLGVGSGGSDSGRGRGLGGVGLGGGTPIPMHVDTLHSDVTVYDRRSGKVVDTKAFDAEGECPSHDFDAGGLFAFAPSAPHNGKAITEWLRTKVHAGP
jgi:hypothetical protein